jgi:hypothetical protein
MILATSPIAGPHAQHPRTDEATLQARRARRVAYRARRAQTPVPVVDAAYDALTVTEVSDLRGDLLALEERAGYWARMLRARLGQPVERPGSVDARGALPLEASRQAHLILERLDVGTAPAVEPLPDLVALWAAPTVVGDETGARRRRADLEAALVQVEEFAAEVRRRRERATRELVARYRDQPQLALLPITRVLVRHATCDERFL